MLSVDASPACLLDHDLELFKQLDDFGLLMIQQPLTAGDLVVHGEQRVEKLTVRRESN